MPAKTNPKNTIKPMNAPTKDAGNALIIILVMIALLAALTAVSMRSSNRSSSNMSTENARIEAEKLMRAAKSTESGIVRLTSANQCSENELNFANATTTRVYTNSNAPTNKKCNLYSIEGAGLTYSNPNASALDASLSSKQDYGQWVFSASHCVLGIGSDDNDLCIDSEVALIAIVPHITLPVCLQLNTMNGITNTSGAPPTESFDESSATFIGSYVAASDPELGEGATGVNLKKHSTGCFKNNSGSWNNSYIFYHVLLSR